MKKILIALLCLPFLMFAQSENKKSNQEEFKTIELGAEIPLMDKKLKSVNGISYSLKTFVKKWVTSTFYIQHMPFCC